jgi:hypothetical protein
MNEATNEVRGAALRRIVPGQHVVVAGHNARIKIPAAPVPREPKLELVRDGDWVQAIDVTCSCGEKIRIVCEYETA